MHLRCIQKNKKRIQKFKETGIQACFQHIIAYENFIDLPRVKATDRILRDKTFNIAKNHILDIKGVQIQLFIIFFNEKASSTNKKTGDNSENKQLAEELNKSINREFEKRKAHSSFIDSTWSADLADMQL